MEAAALPAMNLQACLGIKAHWRESGNPERPWRTTVGEAEWELQLNDFPHEPLYRLFVANIAIGDFDDWPPLWTR